MTGSRSHALCKSQRNGVAEWSCVRIQATRKTHTIHPFSRRRVLIPFDRTFTAEEFERVKLGVVPREMEDHWSIFLEQGWLYFVRSWTGYCIYKVRVEQKNDTARITEAWANRDPRQYASTDAKYDVKMLAMVMDHVLLNPESFP
jgi:hypothetical protein